MPLSVTAGRFLHQEARALRTRLDAVKPLALMETMVPAAAFSPAAHRNIERLLSTGRHDLRAHLDAYLHWLAAPSGSGSDAKEAHRRFTFLRLKFNAILTQIDIFADAMSQRSENETGVWLAGLDALAADALKLPGDYYPSPPVVCYLDRGIGAAIRRTRTRLPGGSDNPVAVIRVPRERMIGSGIASSLIHEVGHQAIALLDLLPSLRSAIRERGGSAGDDTTAWMLWERWISEILSDFWSVARIGIGATTGLMGVVSLPRPFVFRCNPEDPHPMPWIRVQLSIAMGRVLFPHAQWDALDNLWSGFFPLAGLDSKTQFIIAILQKTMPEFISLLLEHRPVALQGATLVSIMELEEKQPADLSRRFEEWKADPSLLRSERPVMAFAVIGQARAEGKLTPERESRLLTRLLIHWAVEARTNSPAFASGREVTTYDQSVQQISGD